MASFVSLTRFMSCPTDRDIDSEITNTRSSKCLPQSLLWQVDFHWTPFAFRSQSLKQILFWGINAYYIHWQIHLHNYMRQNTQFYTFNKDNIEQETQAAASVWRLCLSKMTSDSEVFRRFSIKAVAYLSMWSASKASFKTTVTLFLGKKLNISD